MTLKEQASSWKISVKSLLRDTLGDFFEDNLLEALPDHLEASAHVRTLMLVLRSPLVRTMLFSSLPKYVESYVVRHVNELSLPRELVEKILTGDLEKARELVTSYKNDFGRSLLHVAVENDDTDMFEALIKNVDVNLKDVAGRTPLHCATLSKAFACAMLLIERGADVNAKDNFGFTPIHWASLENKWEIAELLIAKGADVNARIWEGGSKFVEEIIGGLLKENTINTLRKTLYAQRLARDLVGTGIKIPILLQIFLLGTPLVAVWLGRSSEKTNQDNSETSLPTTSPHEAVERKGFTALHIASCLGHTEIAKLLVDKGADPNAKDYLGFTPLHWATAMSHVELVNLLLQHGADIDAKALNDITPLHIAAALGSRDVIKSFIIKGVDINAKDTHGDTPAHWAAAFSRPEITKFLVENGANLTIKNADGKTPEDLWSDILREGYAPIGTLPYEMPSEKLAKFLSLIEFLLWNYDYILMSIIHHTFYYLVWAFAAGFLGKFQKPPNEWTAGARSTEFLKKIEAMLETEAEKREKTEQEQS